MRLGKEQLARVRVLSLPVPQVNAHARRRLPRQVVQGQLLHVQRQGLRGHGAGRDRDGLHAAA